MRLVLSHVLTGAGLTGMALVAAVYLHGVIGSQVAIADFEQRAADQAPRIDEFDPGSFSPDQSLWSDTARANFTAAAADSDKPVALLRIERLNVLAPVFPGTDKVTLNRGIGVVEGSPMPGETGNVALSAHRDSFFRPLKDVAVGDVIELQTLRGTLEFEVAEISIVDPLNTSVLEQTGDDVLTLITCYPFYFVGFAPDRYIVRASLVRKGQG
jgi:sortase A